MSKSFYFPRRWYEMVKELNEESRGYVYDAIINYMLYGNDAEGLPAVAQLVFDEMKRDAANYE